MALKRRTILVGIVGIAVWGMAVKIYLDKRAEDRRIEQERTQRLEQMKPKPPKFGPGKGDFETYFTERHELSNQQELTRRLALRPRQLQPTTSPAIAPGVTEDAYEISKQIYRIYVPENYSAQVPHGIIYYMGYKDTTSMPMAWRPTLDEKHLIFISIRNHVRPDWQQAAVALDAVHNLKKQYAVDEKRIYLFEFPDNPGLVGLQMGLGLADVFTGLVHIDRLEHYRGVPIPELNRSYPPQLGPPPAALLSASKTRPHAYVLQEDFYVRPGIPDKRPYFRTALERDGFTRVMFLNIADREDLHYPNFNGPWLTQTLEFIERAQ